MVSTRILIVEDGRVVALHLKKNLEMHDYVVTGIASSGKQAIEMIEETTPDLVLMDIMLKGDMDGVSAAEYIFELFDIPVVFLTAYSDEGIVERAKLTVPFGYIIKPFQERELITNIEIALYRHKMEKDLKARQKWFSSLVHSMEDAVIATDGKEDIVIINPSAQSLTGWGQNEVQGRSFGEVFQFFDTSKGERVVDPVAYSMEKGLLHELSNSYVLLTKYGTKIRVNLRTSLIRDERNDVIGSVIFLNDAPVYSEEERSILQAKAEAESMIRVKCNFLADVSHDLRTPLNSIIGFSDILLTNSFGQLDERQSRYLNNISTSGKYMLDIINNILELSKTEDGKMVLRFEDVYLPDVFEELMSSLKPIASGKEVVIKSRIDNELDMIRVDRVKFKQVLYNLMNNAIKFTPEGGTVIADARLIGDLVSISVIDTGVGISQEHQKMIFNPFVQLEGSVSKQAGTGLGLSIVKKLVEMHGGDISVISRPGEGSEFTFTIPVEPVVDG